MPHVELPQAEFKVGTSNLLLVGCFGWGQEHAGSSQPKEANMHPFPIGE